MPSNREGKRRYGYLIASRGEKLKALNERGTKEPVKALVTTPSNELKKGKFRKVENSTWTTTKGQSCNPAVRKVQCPVGIEPGEE